MINSSPSIFAPPATAPVPTKLRGWKKYSIVRGALTGLVLESNKYALSGPVFPGSYRLVEQAICKNVDGEEPCDPGNIPNLECKCGWYAFKSLEDSLENYTDNGCMFEVALYGNYLMGETGYRSQYQRINTLMLTNCTDHDRQVVAFRENGVLMPLVGVCSLCISQSMWESSRKRKHPERFVTAQSVLNDFALPAGHTENPHVNIRTLDRSEVWSDSYLKTFVSLPRNKRELRVTKKIHRILARHQKWTKKQQSNTKPQVAITTVGAATIAIAIMLALELFVW